LIAKLMQEEEDLLRAQELQNDYYSGNRPPTAVGRGNNNTRTNAAMEDDFGGMGYRAPDETRYDRLIADPRDELFTEEWDFNEHIGGVPARSNGNANRGRSGVVAGSRGRANDDDEYQKAIIESMKNSRPGDITTEDEILAKVIENSYKDAGTKPKPRR